MTADIRVVNEFLDSLILHPKTPDEVRGGESLYYDWSPSLPFSSELYATEIEKTPGRDFVILNLADIQCHDGEAFSQVGEFYEETIEKLINKTSPDLITLTGDNAFDPFAYLKLIRFLDSFGIPWAPVMGNADHTGLVSEFWGAYQLAEAKNCLFDYGPKGMGDGNYIIHITENGKPIHTLFMMDSHHEEEMVPGSYDHFYENQIAWYRWAVEGIAREVRQVVPSTVFMHIPVPEYQNAWDAIQAPDGGLIPPYNSHPFCKVHEKMGPPNFNNGFFALCKELDSTKNMVCGHDHVNCFSIDYQGITLTYGMKTGYGCYWERETNGGTTLTIDSDGLVKPEHHYVDPRESKVKAFLLEYYGINRYSEGVVVKEKG
ncbi:MAG: hypothetical protein E7428_06070 [Ruminococcaceae bacterium]|nr:hypothetical protein [Oscillospiraceae bacterium]